MRKISRAVVAATAGGALFGVAAFGAPAMAEAANPHHMGCLLHTCESSDDHQGHDDHGHHNDHEHDDHEPDDNDHEHDNGHEHDDNDHEHEHEHDEPDDEPDDEHHDEPDDDVVAEPTAPAAAVTGQPTLTG